MIIHCSSGERESSYVDVLTVLLTVCDFAGFLVLQLYTLWKGLWRLSCANV